MCLEMPQYSGLCQTRLTEGTALGKSVTDKLIDSFTKWITKVFKVATHNKPAIYKPVPGCTVMTKIHQLFGETKSYVCISFLTFFYINNPTNWSQIGVKLICLTDVILQ